MTKPLSPAAEAIFFAADGMQPRQYRGRALAAALRALADQIAPVWKTPPSEEYELEYGQWITNNRIRRDILAIATELENAQ